MKIQCVVVTFAARWLYNMLRSFNWLLMGALNKYKWARRFAVLHVLFLLVNYDVDVCVPIWCEPIWCFLLSLQHEKSTRHFEYFYEWSNIMAPSAVKLLSGITNRQHADFVVSFLINISTI